MLQGRGRSLVIFERFHPHALEVILFTITSFIVNQRREFVRVHILCDIRAFQSSLPFSDL